MHLIPSSIRWTRWILVPAIPFLVVAYSPMELRLRPQGQLPAR
jgi:hypothetical protein